MRMYGTSTIGMAILLTGCWLCSTAQAGVPSEVKLKAMGLAGARVATDAEGMTVRGHGYRPSGSIVGGISWAYVGDDFDAASINFYLAFGKYYASGENFSHATKTKIDTKIVIVHGVVLKEIKSHTTHVSAGGHSSAISF